MIIYLIKTALVKQIYEEVGIDITLYEDKAVVRALASYAYTLHEFVEAFNDGRIQDNFYISLDAERILTTAEKITSINTNEGNDSEGVGGVPC